MLPELGGKSFDILKVLQNVILELQGEMDKNKDGPQEGLTAQGALQEAAGEAQLDQDAAINAANPPENVTNPSAHVGGLFVSKSGAEAPAHPTGENQSQMLADPLQRIS